MVIKESQLREMIKKSIVEHLEEGRFTDFLEKVKKFGRSGAETFFNNTTDDSREWEGEPIDSLHIGPRRGNKVINKIDKALEDFGEPNNGN